MIFRYVYTHQESWQLCNLILKQRLVWLPKECALILANIQVPPVD